MADKQPKKAKRTVKNPETFRERAQKATDQADKPKRRQLKPASAKEAEPGKKTSNDKALRAATFAPRLVGKILLPPYIRKSWAELRQVTWPSWRESRRLTYAVLVFSIAFGAAIALVDFGLDKVFREILLK
jgi:preprotein translocase SecE subunit